MSRRAMVLVVVSITVAAAAAAVIVNVPATVGRVVERLSRATAVSDVAPAPASRAVAGAVPVTANPPRGDVTLDTRRQQLIGVRTTRVTRTVAAPSIRAVGTVRADETRLKEINLKIDGWIRHLDVDFTGRRIRKGDALFTLYSPEILATEREYLLAIATRDSLAQSRVTDVHRHADDLVAAALQRLALWDIPQADIASLEDTRNPLGIVVFRSPVAGIVLEKQAIEGMHVTPGQTLYKVADLSMVWVEADVYERDARAIRIGMPATITVDAYPGESFSGKTTFLYPTVNEETRTFKVRLALSNRQERLKPGMYAQVVMRGLAASALVVPSDAVLDSGTEQVVFLAQGEGRFHPQHVKTGRRLPDGIEIIEGVKEGEEIATSAAFFLDSESQLRGALQSYDVPSAGGAVSAGGGARLDMTLRTQPDPPKVGENTFEVVVKDASGAPVSDGEVSLQFYMRPMPTMNMPAMQNTVKLAPANGGVYRGKGDVLMGGRWDVTVTVTRQGQRLGSTQIAMVTR